MRFVAVAIAVACAPALTSCSSSSSGAARPLPLGTATATVLAASQCGSTTSPVPISRCYRVTVACPDVAPLDAVVKVTDPAGASSGTILFGSGGGGGGFYELFGADAVNRILLPLSQRGFRLVQRSWLGPDGWLTGPGGTLRLACRYATLLDWVSTELHTGGALCATGNSGGSSEVAYAMAHYGLGRKLDLGMPTAGPPMGRIDYGCLGTAQVPGWAQQCASLSSCASGSSSCQYTGGPQELFDQTYGAGPNCVNRNPAWADTWHDDSVVSAGAQLDYPQTKMRFVYGTADCSEAETLGRLYASAITSDSGVVIVPAAPHAVPSVAAGAQAIADVLSAECVPRH